jgi:hypothetical protein
VDIAIRAVTPEVKLFRSHNRIREDQNRNVETVDAEE